MRSPALAAMTVWTLVACSEREPHAAARPQAPVETAHVVLEVPPSQAGRLILEAGALSFIPCDPAVSRVRLRDLPNGEGAALVKEFRGGDGAIPALLRVHDDSLIDIRFAAPEEPDCGRLPRAGVVEARGNEPFWTVEVYGDSARLRVPLSPGGVVFTNGTWRHLTNGQWAYEARRGQTGSEEFLLLELTETRCTDSMSGARYPFVASLIRDGEPARGCAVE